MNLRNVLTVFGTAAVTAALTIGLLGPQGGAQALPAVQPVIAQPQLTSQGCTFSLTTDKATYQAGEAPVIEVKASNPTDKPVTASVWVSATSGSPSSPMSRMLPMPLTFWSHEYAFRLASDETKSLTAACAGLPAGQSISILLTDQKGVILAGSVGVPAQNSGMPGVAGPNAVQPQAPVK